MLIDSQTKIATLLKHNSDALDAIVTLSPDFKKLRNPVLRRLMAGRTSIAMAAKIGGCKPEDFFEKLKPLGFEAASSSSTDTKPGITKKLLPAFLKEVEPGTIVSLDVRPILADGTDPLKLIQQKVKELKDGEVLKIINTFAPTPLIKLLEKQGFQAHVVEVAPDFIETYFYKTSQEGNPQLQTDPKDCNDWDELLKRFENKLQQVDVRHLEMPLPMMTILEALEKIADNTALFVQHKRIPVFLLTELKDRRFDYRIKEIDDSDVQLLIFKN